MHRPILIRIATPRDAAAILSIYAPYVINTAITFEYDVPSEGQMAERIRHVQKKYPFLVALVGDEIVGYAYADAFKERAAYDWAVETTIYLQTGQKRRGIGSQLYEALTNILKMQGVLNMNACIAYPEVDDDYLTRDSVAFHEKLGFRHVGKFHLCGYKFNRWYHIVWMEKHIGAHVENQPGVRNFEAIRTGVREQYGLE